MIVNEIFKIHFFNRYCRYIGILLIFEVYILCPGTFPGNLNSFKKIHIFLGFLWTNNDNLKKNLSDPPHFCLSYYRLGLMLIH